MTQENFNKMVADFFEALRKKTLLVIIDTASKNEKAVFSLVSLVDGKMQRFSPMLTELGFKNYGKHNDLFVTYCAGMFRLYIIDLYNFFGDGKPVCDGLDFDAVCPADMQLIHQQAFCISYDPDWEEHPVLIQCSDTTGTDDSFDLTLDNVPEDVQLRITAWIESQLPTANE